MDAFSRQFVAPFSVQRSGVGRRIINRLPHANKGAIACLPLCFSLNSTLVPVILNRRDLENMTVGTHGPLFELALGTVAQSSGSASLVSGSIVGRERPLIFSSALSCGSGDASIDSSGTQHLITGDAAISTGRSMVFSVGQGTSSVGSNVAFLAGGIHKRTSRWRHLPFETSSGQLSVRTANSGKDGTVVANVHLLFVISAQAARQEYSWIHEARKRL